jgi:hypothetical protein
VSVRTSRHRRAGGVGIIAGTVFSIATALGFVPALGPLPAAAATPGLTMVGATTYDVQPEAGRVAVTVKLTATNHLKDSVTKRYFFRVGYLTVIPGTSNFKVTTSTAGAKPAVTAIAATDTYTNLKIDLGANLAAGKTTTLTLTFDLKDPGGAPNRAVRVSHSLVTLSAWAVATPSTPGASVTVRFPAGYSVTIRRGPLQGPTDDGSGGEIWSSGSLTAPLDYVADISADRPAEYAETTRTVAMQDGPATILLRAWPDDPAWRDRVGALIQRALPVLEREIGSPWPVDGPLAVHEALVRSTGGYAGLFDPSERRIEIAYAASDGIVLHELAHAWFNGGLVAERWAAEGFAAYYAEVAARELGVAADAPVLPTPVDPAVPDPAAIPLNAWSPGTTEAPESGTWPYAASLELARQIADRAGADALRATWAKAEHGIGAYQPDPTGTEEASGPPDWRGLLDLLEDATGKDFTDLWRRWVARPDDLAALAERATARDAYLRSQALAAPWALPPVTRTAMRAWQFDVARELLSATDGVVGQRDRLRAAAEAAGITLPDTLDSVFQGDGGLAGAAAEAQAEQATVDAITGAEGARPGEQGFGEGLVIGVGLLLTEPEVDLAAARAQLAAGDLQAAYISAQSAETAWTSAPRVGRSRILSVALLLLALVVFVGLIRQHGRRNRPEAASE